MAMLMSRRQAIRGGWAAVPAPPNAGITGILSGGYLPPTDPKP